MENQTESSRINRSRPAKCPLEDCSTILSDATLLQHLLQDHDNIEVQPLQEDEKCKVIISEEAFARGKPVCQRIILYGGRNADHFGPAKPGLSLRNIVLHPEHSAYKDQLVVLVMGYKTQRTIFQESMPREDDSEGDFDPRNDLFVFWFVGTETDWPVYGNLTVRNTNGTFCSSDRLEIRDFKAFMNPTSILREGLDYLLISRGGMRLLTGEDQFFFELEISIN
ncbi:uncharacterized protein LOC131438300 [Malaya genurostris]|uniref:uncharacterized protein LOC131438300 n=1 Tax=Malaya genurostris TaxID=325434 RepID=UPI0026F3B564|nr:uncharacterized protein LOC131438300 [Malaya genurostris]